MKKVYGLFSGVTLIAGGKDKVVTISRSARPLLEQKLNT